MLILAFDTATDLATSALVADGEILGESVTRPQALLADVDALLSRAGVVARRSDRGSSSERAQGASPGLASGSLSPVGSGCRSISAWPASRRFAHSQPAAEDAFPIVDAKRGEVFVEGPRAASPAEVVVPAGAVCVGSGACRYRDVLAAGGADVPPDDSPLHVPWASLHARLATAFGPADAVQPVYVRAPDAERWRR